MNPSPEALFFAEDVPNPTELPPHLTWKVLIVDDEPSVHQLTELVLRDFVFENKRIQLFSAYSMAEAQLILSEHDDISFILLDMVMETHDAGLQLVRWVRETLRNQLVRIILRTGQPGLASEDEIILNYEINDYKSKSDLTVQKLSLTVVNALRSYRDLVCLENKRKNMELALDHTLRIQRLKSSQSIQEHIPDIFLSLASDSDTNHHSTNFFMAGYRDGGIRVLRASPNWKDFLGAPFHEVLAHLDNSDLLDNMNHQFFSIQENSLVFKYADNNPKHDQWVFFMEVEKPYSPWKVQLFTLVAQIIFTTSHNLNLHWEIEQSQREMVYALGGITETHSQETSQHVQRVSECAYLLAKLFGMEDEEAEFVRIASALHDVGKIAIPERILNKNGVLDENERRQMQKHTEHGAHILGHVQRRLFQVARDIAWQHHEAWDGSGYPRGLKGEEISLYARITSIADVFDALGNDRVYRKAWNRTQIISFFDSNRGKLFDPVLTEIFLTHYDKFEAILTQNAVGDQGKKTSHWTFA
jgi:response regulator RpfG family c-di-GMP phosphodiesterase